MIENLIEYPKYLIHLCQNMKREAYNIIDRLTIHFS